MPSSLTFMFISKFEIYYYNIVFHSVPKLLILFFSPLQTRLQECYDSIDENSISGNHRTLISSIIDELESRRGWLADRFDALEDQRLISALIQLAIVLLTRFDIIIFQ